MPPKRRRAHVEASAPEPDAAGAGDQGGGGAATAAAAAALTASAPRESLAALSAAAAILVEHGTRREAQEARRLLLRAMRESVLGKAAACGDANGAAEEEEEEEAPSAAERALSVLLAHYHVIAKEWRLDDHRSGMWDGRHPNMDRLEWPGGGHAMDSLFGGCVTGGGRRLPTRGAPAERRFIETVASAARVCRSWRAVARRAVDIAAFRPTSARGLEESLREFDGGVLRAALVVLPEKQPLAEIGAFARALGLAQRLPAAGREHEEAVLVDVLRKLRVLRVTGAGLLADALAPPTPLPPSPSVSPPLAFAPVLKSLVSLNLVGWRSPPSSSSSSRSSLFSADNFPSLRTLRVQVARDSPAPFEVALADPPPIVDMHACFCEHVYRDTEPLAISLRSLDALAPWLRSLRIETTDVDQCNYDEPGMAMSRLLPGTSRLTRLTALRFDNDDDWLTGYEDPRSDELLRPWEADTLALLKPMASSLRRLEVAGWGSQMLPRALSELTALTHLSARTGRGYFYGFENVRGLTALQSLELHQQDFREESICGADLRSLGQLEHLKLSHAPADIAYHIAHGLPSLTSLVFTGMFNLFYADYIESHLLSLRAARFRMRRDGLEFSVRLDLADPAFEDDDGPDHDKEKIVRRLSLLLGRTCSVGDQIKLTLADMDKLITSQPGADGPDSDFAREMPA